MDDLSQNDLVRCRRGDPGGLEVLFRTYVDRVFRTCLGLLGQHADAEDATQDVMLRIFAKIGRFSERSRLSTWIYRVTVNHCLNLRRRRRREQTRIAADAETLTDSGGPTPLEQTSAAEERELLLRRLQRLGPDLAAVLVLREIEGQSYREIAEILGVPSGTVMSRLARARQKLAWLLPRGPDALPLRMCRASTGSDSGYTRPR